MKNTRLLCLVAFVVFLCASPSAFAGPFLFGVSDDDKIHQVNLTNFVDTVVFDTGLTGLLNGAAWDDANGRLYYRNAQDGNLYFWTRATNTQKLLVGQALPAGANADAAFYNGAYWYVIDGTDTLVRATMDFSIPNFPLIANVDTFANFDGTALTSFLFGDIAISGAGVLYGSSDHGLFTSIISGASPAQISIVAPLFGIRQISLDPTDSFLYTQDYATGNWYTSTFTGYETPLFSAPNVQFNSTPLRDLGATLLTPPDFTAAPEPAAWQFLGLGLGAFSLIGFGRKLRSRAAKV